MDRPKRGPDRTSSAARLDRPPRLPPGDSRLDGDRGQDRADRSRRPRAPTWLVLARGPASRKGTGLGPSCRRDCRTRSRDLSERRPNSRERSRNAPGLSPTMAGLASDRARRGGRAWVGTRPHRSAVKSSGLVSPDWAGWSSLTGAVRPRHGLSAIRAITRRYRFRTGTPARQPQMQSGRSGVRVRANPISRAYRAAGGRPREGCRGRRIGGRPREGCRGAPRWPPWRPAPAGGAAGATAP